MASRYWVGGTATWDATAGTKWASTSGGTGGQAVPTSADTVIFDANSGVNTVTLGTGYNPVISILTMTGFTGTLAFGSQNISLSGTGAIFTGATTYSVTGTPVINCTDSSATSRTIFAGGSITEANAISFNITAGTGTVSFSTAGNFKSLDTTGFSGTLTLPTGGNTIYGNLTISSSTTVTAQAGIVKTFAATSGTQIITSNGKTLGFPITINGVGGTIQLADDLTLGSTNTLTLTNGTFNANNKNVNIGLFNSSNSNTRTLTMGSGTWTLSGTGTIWNALTVTNLTFTACPNIILSDTSTAARVFSSGAGLAFNKLTIGGATGTSTTSITGGITYTEIASTKTVAHTIAFTGAVSIGNWTVTGTAGNIVTVNSSAAGNQRTLTYTGSGTISMDYMSITDINFSYTLGPSNPYLVYAGANSTNGGNNAGILFQPTTVKAYLLTTSGSWTVPSDWNSSNNAIHMIGAGGGGASSVLSGNNRAAGGGGGGGGYTVLTNQTLSGSISYVIGAGTANANGGSTTFNAVNIAGGGLKGNATTVPLSTGGAGGTGTTYNGGTGGAGSTSTVAATGDGGGGGGGAGGPNGNGGNGGIGFASTTTANISGGGGGGNGGGSAGGNASSALGGTGGNNFGGTGGGTGGVSGATGGNGTNGGGGGGNAGVGGAGIDISNTVGGAGGKGGASVVVGISPVGYGAGGAGAAVTTAGSTAVGGTGSQGVIFIVYTPNTISVNSGFFFLFG